MRKRRRGDLEVLNSPSGSTTGGALDHTAKTLQSFTGILAHAMVVTGRTITPDADFVRDWGATTAAFCQGATAIERLYPGIAFQAAELRRAGTPKAAFLLVLAKRRRT